MRLSDAGLNIQNIPDHFRDLTKMISGTACYLNKKGRLERQPLISFL